MLFTATVCAQWYYYYSLGSLVVQGLAAGADALLARAQRAEILNRLGHRLAVQA